MRAAQRLSAKDIAAARATCAEAVTVFANAMRGVDAMLSPTLQAMPPREGSDRIIVCGVERPAIPGLTAETCLANVVGGPALTIPSGSSGDRRFIGLTVSALPTQDDVILSVGRRLSHQLNNANG
jgi:Asp-tRNA(Asn)/Glu-tRNA(Gln) amidotransferase A subunit family amidase